jgi:hypothetical protein
MWICEACWDGAVYRAITTRARVLACCGCKGRKPCFLVIRRRLES